MTTVDEEFARIQLDGFADEMALAHSALDEVEDLVEMASWAPLWRWPRLVRLAQRADARSTVHFQRASGWLGVRWRLRWRVS